MDGNDIVAVDAIAREFIAAGPRRRAAFPAREDVAPRGSYRGRQGAYREAAEVEARWEEEPVARCGALLEEAGVDPRRLEAARDEAEREMEAVFEDARAADWPPPSTAFDDVLDTVEQNTETAAGAAG